MAVADQNRSHRMSKNPSSPRTPARFSPGFFTWRKRYGSNLEAPRGAATARPTSTVSYLSTDFDAIDGTIMPVSPSEVPIEYKGYLHKHGRIFRGWKMRYFELQGPHLYCYRDDSKAKCLGEIDLNLCGDVRASTVASFGHAFDIVTTRRIHTLAARTEEEMKQWISFIDVHMAAVELLDKKGTKKRNANRATSIEETSQRPKVEAPVKRGKSFMDKLKSFRFTGRNRGNSSGDDDTSITPPPSLVKQARSEDNLLSPPSSERPISPLLVAYRSTPVSREPTPQPEETTALSVEISPELYEYYNQRFVFDEIKEFLATRPEEGEGATADVLDEFDPEEHPWRKEESAIEQLRGFLATCP